jgi:hypothetical protein
LIFVITAASPRIELSMPKPTELQGIADSRELQWKGDSMPRMLAGWF